ncbi:MAG TPA: beta-N-acetylhexosaminidase [Micromonosporaceae bacterium]
MATDPGLRRLILRTLLAAFPGHTAPDWALALVADGLAGHVLFGRNVADPAQVAALSAELAAVRPDVIISIDEEGGDVTRLGHLSGSPYPGNAALGVIDDAALTERIYHAIGTDLGAVGVNLDLAPTVDVNTVDENPIIGTRSFGADPARVATHTAAAVRGLQSAGVAACAKHFPGHGATVADSHLELPTVDAPLDVLRQRDLPPFASAVQADIKAIMTAHIRVPSLTGEHPATFSRRVLVDLLRTELGFQGAVITDALEMKGASVAAGGTAKAAVPALAAGADLLCVGSDVTADLIEEVVAEVAAAIGDGRLALSRVEQAADRGAALASWAVEHARRERSESGIGYPAARRAVQIHGSLDGLSNPLVVQLESEATIAAGRVPWGLGPHVNGTEQVRLLASAADAAQLRARAGTRPIVVVARNAHRLPGGRALIEDLAATNPVVLVEMGWPSNWRPVGVRAVVCTYGASHANGWAAADALGLAAAR